MRKLLIVGLLLSACNIHYGDGSRMGTVSKLSKKGLFCKTWEGQLYIAAKDVMQPERWDFSVEDERVVPALQEAMRSGKQVELVYKELQFTTPCSPDSDYRIVEVK